MTVLEKRDNVGHIVGIGICNGGIDWNLQADNPSSGIHKSDIIAIKIVRFLFDFFVVPNLPECKASPTKKSMIFSRFIQPSHDNAGYCVARIIDCHTD